MSLIAHRKERQGRHSPERQKLPRVQKRNSPVESNSLSTLTLSSWHLELPERTRASRLHSRIALSNTSATGHMWLFTFKLKLKFQFLSRAHTFQVLNNSHMWLLVTRAAHIDHVHPSESSLGRTILEKGETTLHCDLQLIFRFFLPWKLKAHNEIVKAYFTRLNAFHSTNPKATQVQKLWPLLIPSL